MPKIKENQVTHKNLISMISESSNYHKYEIEDILSHLTAHIELSLIEGKTVKIKGLGELTAFKKKGRKFYSGISKKEIEIGELYVISLKSESGLLNALKEKRC